ncbi:hypothetical protein ElyMa_003277000 [Elysia marginata]|uniref:Uncharacterized protein n=1 Tax=Elysia marginata TaxID=1093978 RepID=A0AAV4JAF5_9GAST|nr:hypothetical protein ElyMa_003277000 [Elysia marginata]
MQGTREMGRGQERGRFGRISTDIGGDNPIHCERAVIGFIKQSQLASSRKRAEIKAGGGRFDRGRGMGRGGPLLDRGRGYRGMRGGPPSRGGRGGGGYGGYGGGGDMDGGMHYNEEEEYYGGEGEYWEGDGYGGGEYPAWGRGGARGGPPQRAMRGGPPGARGRGGPPGSRGGYPGREGAPSARGGYPSRGAPGMSEHGGRPFRKTLLPNPPDMRGGRGGGRGRGYPPQPPAQEEYYPEEEAAGYGEEYGGGEEYYEEDQYNNGAGYAEEEQYGAVDEGYYGLPEAPQRPAPPVARGRGSAPPRGGGRIGPGGMQMSHMGSEQPSTRGARPPARGSGPYSRGGGGGGGGASQMPPPRSGPATGRGPGPARPMPSEPARRPASHDQYGYMEEPAGPPRQRAAPTQQPAYDDYYGEEDMGSMHAARDPYASARPPAAARSQQAPPSSARGAPPSRHAADPYADEQYRMYEGGDASEGYGEDYSSPYGGAARPARRGAAPPLSQARSSAGGRSAEGRGYVDISEYIGLGGSSGSRYRDEYQGQGSGRDMDRMEREPRRPAPSRREDPYMERRVAEETDAYVSYPTSSRDPIGRKRPGEGYESGSSHLGGYEEYRGAAAPSKRDRGSGYDSYPSRHEGKYRRL